MSDLDLFFETIGIVAMIVIGFIYLIRSFQ